VSGKELKQLRNSDRVTRGSLAARTFWSPARVEQIEAQPYVADCTVRIYLRALDGSLKFRRDTEERKAVKSSAGVLTGLKG
jgi:hypothetical protein